MPPTQAMEDVLNLFELYWSNRLVVLPFSDQPRPPPPSGSPPESSQEDTHLRNLQLPPLRGLHHRSNSDSSSSPVSVLQHSKLETVLSGKESSSTLEGGAQDWWLCQERRRRRKKKKGSRSLSELEYEELRGLMDLGFVFPKEEIDSKLISIVPGLQRRVDRGEKEREADVSRPYLSEAWENPLRDWRVPAAGEGVDMKDHLRWWAQAVASTVR